MKKAAAILILCIELLCLTGIVSAGDIDAVRAQVFAWQSVSEEWRPLLIAGRPDRSTKAAELNTKSQAEIEQATRQQQGLEANKPSTGKTVVKSIRFGIENKMEKVFVDLNQYAIPEIRTLEGDKPRIVLDFMNADFWRGSFRIPANGKLVKQVRAYLHRKVGKLRIVLDLNPAEDYVVDQTFYKAENIYCITVQ